MNFDDLILNSNTSGLANTHSTCYVNTAIQCLGFCPSFLKHILCSSQPNSFLFNELKEIYIELWVHKKSIAPNKFLMSLHKKLGSYLHIFEQNDILEFLMLYIDKLNEDSSSKLNIDTNFKDDLKKKIRQTSSNKAFQKLILDVEMNWINHIKNECSPFKDMFYGQLISQIICGSCNHIHHNYEIYSTLPLPIKDTMSKSYSLYDVLETYFEKEYINNDIKEWTCDECKTKTKSVKCLKLWKTPQILIICLKRFDHTLKKKTTQVIMPTVLDMTKYSLINSECKYELKAVANHVGSFGSGHYNCICHHKNGSWIAIDDMLVKNASNDEIEYVLNHGYVYFYEKITAI